MIAFYGLLPAIVRGFRQSYPDVQVDLVERNSPDLEAALLPLAAAWRAEAPGAVSELFLEMIRRGR